MTKFNRLLIALLLLQVGILIVAQLMPAEQKLAKPKAMLSLDPKSVVEIRIVDGSTDKKKTVVLARQPSGWIVKSHGGYAAKKGSVDELLGKLTLAKAGAPVATSKTHHHALEVAAEKFQREVRITLRSGKSTTLYLGSTPGLKKAHLRLAASSDVFAAGPLSTWDVGGDVSSWVDTQYFSVPKKDIVEVELTNAKGAIKLRREGAAWVLAEGQGELDSTKVDGLLGSFARVNMREPVGETIQPAHGLEKPLATILIHSKKKVAPKKGAGASSQPSTQPVFSRATHRLRIGSKKDDTYFAKSDESSFVVKLDSYIAEDVIKKTLADLLKKKDDKKPTAPAGMGMPGRGMLPPGMRPPAMRPPGR